MIDTITVDNKDYQAYKKLVVTLIYILERNGMLISERARSFGMHELPSRSKPPFEYMNEAGQVLWGEDIVEAPLNAPKSL